MGPSGISPVLATVAAGLRTAQRRTAEAAEVLATPGGAAPTDTAEFSKAAQAVSPESLIAAVRTFAESLAATEALSIMARVEGETVKKTLDILA
jgi:hypothetical protein